MPAGRGVAMNSPSASLALPAAKAAMLGDDATGPTPLLAARLPREVPLPGGLEGRAIHDGVAQPFRALAATCACAGFPP